MRWATHSIIRDAYCNRRPGRAGRCSQSEVSADPFGVKYPFETCGRDSSCSTAPARLSGMNFRLNLHHMGLMQLG